MRVSLPILYSQYDARWANNLLGNNTQQPYNMYNYGCLVTSWAMVCQYYGKAIDPGQLNVNLKNLPNHGGFDGSGNYIPGGVHLLYGDIKEVRTVTTSLVSDAQLGEIRTALDNGYPVIIGIDVNPRTVAYDSHFVVIVDYNPNDENDFTIADPLGGFTRSLKDYLGFLVPKARATIYSYIITGGPKPVVGPDMITISKDHYDLYLRNHDQWHKMVNYLKPGADPNATRFEDLQTIVAGIKSRQTDLENQLSQALDGKRIAEQEIANQKDKVANIEAECQRKLETQQAEYESIIANTPDYEKLVAQYKGIIENLEGQLREANKQVGLLNLEIAQLKGDVEVVGLLDKLIQWIKQRLNK